MRTEVTLQTLCRDCRHWQERAGSQRLESWFPSEAWDPERETHLILDSVQRETRGDLAQPSWSPWMPVVFPERLQTSIIESN